VEICNAGHLPPVLVQGGQIKKIEGSGLPVGIFCDETYRVEKLRFGVGDTLVLFTDGISEAEDYSGTQYGMERLFQFVDKSCQLPLGSLVADCIGEVRSFRNGAPVKDDLTLMAIRRVSSATA
jgi:sigma-B regulation protein RsbU (phosphoserine phosphatase)